MNGRKIKRRWQICTRYYVLSFCISERFCPITKIREYFKLDTVLSSTMPTWDKAISLARFVAENIPHANQKINPKRCNAIDLWKYTRSIEPAFNCRLHSILLHELLHFVTCHPADSEDSDCHVVNLVWLPELQKWAMLDSDMNAWAEDEKALHFLLQKCVSDILTAEKLFTVLS